MLFIIQGFFRLFKGAVPFRADERSVCDCVDLFVFAVLLCR